MATLSFSFLTFVIVVFSLSLVCNNRIKKIVILSANVIFLLSFGRLVHLLWVLVAVGYSYLIILASKKNRKILLVGIVPLVLSLAYFKYFGLWTNTNIIMPLGISFYTFKIISVFVDNYRGKLMDIKPLDYAIYVSFFPVVSAGPINRYDSFIKYLQRNKCNYDLIRSGGLLLGFGLFQKLVFADFLGIVSSSIFNQKTSGLTTLFGIIVYAFYIYADFDSYSNIAIGISRMLGFELPRNFKTPYLASSIMQFWDRWHISLSTWLKDYIYIPLGGNRKGIARKFLNILIVFLISGIWHGSTLVFIIWGLGHGLINIVENVVKQAFVNVNFSIWQKRVGKVLGMVLNFFIVSFLWVFFRSDSLNEALAIISSLFEGTYGKIDFQLVGMTIREVYWTIGVIIIIVITDIMRNHQDMIQWIARRNFIVRWFIYVVMAFIALVFGVYGPGYDAQAFIYAVF